MGLGVSKYRKEVESLWALSEAERNRELERLLRKNRPINAEGEEVTSLKKLFTSPPLSKQALRQQDRQLNGNNGRFGRHTSGTTGEPTHITLSRSELGRMLGVRDYCFSYYGVRLGQREARLWGRPSQGLRLRLKNFLLNRKVYCPIGDDAEKSVTSIIRWEPDYLYGYASLLLEAAALLEKNSLQFKPPRCVICTAETIMPAQKEFLARVFSAPVVEEYGATEFDILAFEDREGRRHFVNPWIVAQEKDGLLLISDVSRKSCNLINYDIGDSGTIKDSGITGIGSPHYLAALEGRSIHRFAYVDSETRFHSVDLAYAIDDFQRAENVVFNFRILQREIGVIDLYVSEAFSKDFFSLQQFIINCIRKKTGRDIVIRVMSGDIPDDLAGKSYFVQKIANPTADVENR
jgi:phenylacetate-CoA ligase